MKLSRSTLLPAGVIVMLMGILAPAVGAESKPQPVFKRTQPCMRHIAGWHNACMFVSETEATTKGNPRVAIVRPRSGRPNDMVLCGRKVCGSIRFVNHTVIVKLGKHAQMTAGMITTVAKTPKGRNKYIAHHIHCQHAHRRYTFKVTAKMGKLAGAWINIYIHGQRPFMY